MPKSRQKIVVFIEPAEYLYETPYKIGNLITNRFTINEELNNDIVKIVHVAHRFYELRKLDKKHGMDLCLAAIGNLVPN